MFKKVTVANNLSHKKLVGYSDNTLYHDRLKKAQATDLHDNYKIIDHGNGFATIQPIDSKKKMVY